MNPKETGYYWGTRFNDERKDLSKINPFGRTAWHRAAWELDYTKGRRFKGGETQFVDKALLNQDWARFAHVLGQRKLAKLDQAKIEYRLPIPGARLEQGTLKANVALTGLQIQYSLDQGKNWVAYEASAATEQYDAGSVGVGSATDG